MKLSKFLMAVAAIALVSCGNKNNQQQEQQVADELPEVRVATVVSKSIPQVEEYSATVESDLKNNITPNMSLRIDKILVDEGDHVSKGQVLVQLNKSSLEQARLQLNNQKVEFNRVKQLYEVGGTSKSAYDAAKMQLDVLQTQVRHLAENATLRAPISGIVTARNYDDGDMYNGTPILTIEQTAKVKVRLEVSEIHYKDVHKGQLIDISLDAYPGEKFEGHVTTVFPTVDQTTHTFEIEVTINNQSQKVRPGMFARATVNYGNQTHVVVPDESLVKQIGAGDRYVYVYDPQKHTVSYNKVQLGQHIGDYYEIFSGVSDGQQVVTAGQSRLANGRKVKVVK